MVEVLGAAIISAAFTSSSVAAAVSTATILGVSTATIVGTTALVTGSLAFQALTASDDRQRVAGQQYASKQSLPARRRAYGRVKLSGPYLAYDRVGGSFINAVYLCEGPIAAIEQIWLDDTVAALAEADMSGLANVEPWLDHVGLQKFLGTPDQAASGILSKLPYWSAQHRAAGCAYVVMEAVAPNEKKFIKRFPKGSWPTTRAQIRAARVRNPADPAHTADPATWQWTDLCTPCIRDLITHPQWGMRVPVELIDEPSFAAATLVDGGGVLDKTGTQIPRYRLSGSYEMTEEPAESLQKALDACARTLFLTPEGKIGITGGVYVAPTVTLRQDAILSIGSLEVGNGTRSAFNRLNTSYVSPDHDFQLIEGSPWIDASAIAEAGETLEADFSQPWVNHHNQLARLAKIHMARENPAYRLKDVLTNRKGLPALFEDSVWLDLPRYGIALPFAIERAVAASDGATCAFDFVSLDPAAWDFNAALEEGDVTPPTAAQPEALPPPPANLNASITRTTVNGDLNAAFLRLECAAPARADLSLIGRYRQVGAADWIDMTADSESVSSVVSQVLGDGVEYEVQGALAGYGRAVQSAWIATDPPTIVATADASSTGPVTGFVVNGGDDEFGYAFTAPNAPNFGSAKIYLGSTDTFANATVVRTVNGSPSQAFDGKITNVAPGQRRVWVVALNKSGVGDASSRVGPLIATVT